MENYPSIIGADPAQLARTRYLNLLDRARAMTDEELRAEPNDGATEWGSIVAIERGRRHIEREKLQAAASRRHSRREAIAPQILAGLLARPPAADANPCTTVKLAVEYTDALLDALDAARPEKD